MGDPDAAATDALIAQLMWQQENGHYHYDNDGFDDSDDDYGSSRKKKAKTARGKKGEGGGREEGIDRPANALHPSHATSFSPPVMHL